MSPALIQLIETLLLFAVQHGPELVDEVKTALTLANQATPLTAEQEAQVQASLDKAHNALSAAILARAQAINAGMPNT